MFFINKQFWKSRLKPLKAIVIHAYEFSVSKTVPFVKSEIDLYLLCLTISFHLAIFETFWAYFDTIESDLYSCVWIFASKLCLYEIINDLFSLFITIFPFIYRCLKYIGTILVPLKMMYLNFPYQHISPMNFERISFICI